MPSDDVAAAPAAAAVPMALDMPPPPLATDVGATGGRGRGRAPGSRGRGGRYGLAGRGLGSRGGVVAGSVAHQAAPGPASLQQVPEGSSQVDAALLVASAAPAALDMPPSPPPTAVTSLADAQFSTGRPEPPESTIGGQSTCIICFTNPKTHLAAPCGHQCACADCSAQMHECPVCRTPVQMWMQVRVA